MPPIEPFLSLFIYFYFLHNRFTLKPSGDIFVKSVLTENKEYELVINARDQGIFYFVCVYTDDRKKKQYFYDNINMFTDDHISGQACFSWASVTRSLVIPSRSYCPLYHSAMIAQCP